MKIGKSIIAIILSSFTGLVLNPEVLTALDMQKFSDIDTSRVVETVLPPMPTPQVTIVPQTVAAPAPTYAFTEVVEPVRTVTNAITVDGKEIALSAADTLAEDAGTKVKAWYYTETGKFIYAHNLDTVFGGLKNLAEGDTFTVSYGGETKVYSVATAVVYEYDGTILTKDGAGNYMKYIKEARSSKSVAYDMALMTCHGADDSERLVIFANEI